MSTYNFAVIDVKSVPAVKPNQRQTTTVNASSKNLSSVQTSSGKPRDTLSQTLPHSTPKKQSSSTQPQRNMVSYTKNQRGKSVMIPNKRAREEYEKQFPVSTAIYLLHEIIIS